MTWGEFKALVEKELINQAVPPDEIDAAEINYIDISYPHPDRLEVHVTFSGHIEITD